MIQAPLASIERVAVFRALVLGDMLCAVPALRALRAGLPRAEIALIGLPPMRELVERLDCIDRFVEFPGYPGLPERACDLHALPGFLARMQGERFDLAVQLHGSGGIVNPLVASFGARLVAGFRDDVAWWPREHDALFVRWPHEGHEIDRLLALTSALGFAPHGRDLDFPLTGADRIELRAVLGDEALGRYACVHAGSQLPSRRWDVERFAAVADGLVERGLRVVLTGSAGERELVDALARSMRRPALNLAGRTTLWTLGALVEGAELVLCNDTGVSHIAAALETPSVVVSSGADAARWAPLAAELHPVLWAPMACRPCAHAVCPTGHGCAKAIGVDEAIAAVDRLASARPAAGCLARRAA